MRSYGLRAQYLRTWEIALDWNGALSGGPNLQLVRYSSESSRGCCRRLICMPFRGDELIGRAATGEAGQGGAIETPSNDNVQAKVYLK